MDTGTINQKIKERTPKPVEKDSKRVKYDMLTYKIGERLKQCKETN